MSAALALAHEATSLQSLADMAVLSLGSPSSRRNYSRELRLFLLSGHSLSREGVLSYLGSLRDAGKGSVTRNIALSAVRLLAQEANARGLISDADLYALERIKGAKVLGSSCGNWLDLQQVRLFIESVQGENRVRNQALLACMCGCALRRAEAASLTWDHWQMRGGRWCLVDLKGKGGRMRTIPAPPWVARYMERWRQEQEERTKE